MAFFIRTSTGRLKAYYWDELAQKQRQIPRSEYSHLDEGTDDQARQWLNLWEQENGKQRLRIAPSLVFQADEVSKLYKDFISERQKLRNISATTVADESSRFTRYVLQFFVTLRKEKNVRRWEFHAADLAPHQLDQNHLEVNQIKKVLGLLKRFGSSMVRLTCLTENHLLRYLVSEPNRLFLL